MRRLTTLFLLVGTAAALVLAGCQRDDHDVNAKLDQINQHLAKIETLLAKNGGSRGAARPMPRRPQMKRPDSNAVYSVPIASAPYEGPKKAKVTIVEAFDYA